jgi:peroxiredoxin
MMSPMKRNVLALVGGLAIMGFAAPMAYAQGGRDQGMQQKEKERKQEGKPDGKQGEGKQLGKAEGAKIGEPAPTFTLTDTDGKTHKLEDLKGKVVVLEWYNAECPYVVKHHVKNKTMANLAEKYKAQDVVWLAVNSNVPGTQGAGKTFNADAKKDMQIAYPIMLDDNASVSKAYGAKTTPHMYIIDKNGILVYNGAIDNNPSPSKLGDVNYVDQALTQVLAGETVSEPTSKPYGCSVKYPKGQ